MIEKERKGRKWTSNNEETQLCMDGQNRTEQNDARGRQGDGCVSIARRGPVRSLRWDNNSHSRQTVDIATRSFICGHVHVCQIGSNSLDSQETIQQENTAQCPNPWCGLPVTPVRPCVAFHNLAKWSQQSRERLSIQSRYFKPREVRTGRTADCGHCGCAWC
jgi:hypothetical protein